MNGCVVHQSGLSRLSNGPFPSLQNLIRTLEGPVYPVDLMWKGFRYSTVLKISVTRGFTLVGLFDTWICCHYWSRLVMRHSPHVVWWGLLSQTVLSIFVANAFAYSDLVASRHWSGSALKNSENLAHHYEAVVGKVPLICLSQHAQWSNPIHVVVYMSIIVPTSYRRRWCGCRQVPLYVKSRRTSCRHRTSESYPLFWKGL